MSRARVPEAFVSWLWERRQVVETLRADDGRFVQVVYPGRRAGSWGPDFRGAVVVLDGQVLRGDVEVHVTARDWYAHGHHSDSAYERTVLHVVFEAARAFPAVRSDGEVVPTVALTPHLIAPVDVALAAWNADLSPDPSLRPCRTPEEAAVLLDRAGAARFEGKAARFEADLTCVAAPQALWTGVLEALGFAANTSAFRHLADRVPWLEALHLVRRGGPLALETILLGEAGLLPTQRGRFPVDGPSTAIENAWGATGRRGPAHSLGWRWVGCRPGNGPVRRVVGAAALVDEELPSLQERMLTALCELPPSRAAPALRALLVRSAAGYWQMHADFGRPLARPAALVGPDRAAEAVVNAVLPWAAAVGRATGDTLLLDAARAAYREHPRLASNQITRHMARQIAGPEAKQVVTTARRQQGLIHIYRGWCDARDCLACPAGGDRRTGGQGTGATGTRQWAIGAG